MSFMILLFLCYYFDGFPYKWYLYKGRTEQCPDMSRLHKLLVFLIYFLSDTGWLAGWLASF